MQAIVDHHHADVKTASKVRFAEPGADVAKPEDAPSPPLSEAEDKESEDNKVTPDSLLHLQFA